MPSTYILGSDLTVNWPEVVDNGSPITTYYLIIRDHDGEYHTELEYCNGEDATIVSERSCTIPLTVFYIAPFNMVLGDHIYVKVTAINLYGASLESVPGDGAAIVFLPEAPLNLANNAALTTDTEIGLTWSAGVSDGGRPVEDYKVWYDQGTNIYTDLAVVVDDFYLAESLVPGNTYKFKIQSRNSVGYSPFSNEVSILAGEAPSTPEAPTTVSSAD